ncbi:hypothetical protein CHS0354_037966 [Potamilus streckersoni]|uniref:Uncharacterized protein n=1 Tax=Potamilus streckersoni TaxID=2493646 RepID=A0AAE0T9K4_9BIVA|nr:hypothetical protein CHS0354_037966 [Potamilus streckersoni]
MGLKIAIVIRFSLTHDAGSSDITSPSGYYRLGIRYWQLLKLHTSSQDLLLHRWIPVSVPLKDTFGYCNKHVIII